MVVNSDLKQKLHKSKSSLTVILGYLQMLETNITSEDNLDNNLAMVQKAITAGHELQMLLESLDQD